jgi:protein-S-isoprenylcysteine O-methyltransferase Ste14
MSGAPSWQVLELRIPPPVVAALIAGAMWGISAAAPVIDVPGPARTAVAAILALAGGVFVTWAMISFLRARTTINPMKPEATSSLVRTGVYRISRNPMYVGLVFVLVGWAAYLASAWALLGPVAFVLYMNWFQIAPEERVLAALFGAEYSAYASTVRRWL